METTWSSVFCSKFNWKSHSCTTKQWKNLQLENISRPILCLYYILNQKRWFPHPQNLRNFQFERKNTASQNIVFFENVWWPLVSKILASSNSSSSSSLSWHKRGGDVFLCGKKNVANESTTKLREWLEWRIPNSKQNSNSSSNLCVFNKHSNLHKLEKRLKVGWIWDSPTGFKMPKILPGHTRTVWGENSRVRELFGSPQSMEKFYRSQVGFWLSVFFAKKPLKVMSNLTSPDAQVCGDMRVMSDVGGI